MILVHVPDSTLNLKNVLLTPKFLGFLRFSRFSSPDSHGNFTHKPCSNLNVLMCVGANMCAVLVWFHWENRQILGKVLESGEKHFRDRSNSRAFPVAVSEIVFTESCMGQLIIAWRTV